MKNITCLLIFAFNFITVIAQKWDKKYPAIAGTFNKISFINDSIGFLVGDDGGIGKSSDGGNTWKKIKTTSNSSLISFDFRDNGVGFSIGNSNEFLKTVDSGENWIVTPFSVSNPSDIKFISNNTGFITCYSRIYKSIDSGVNWQDINISANPANNYLNSISFIGNDTGYVVGDQNIILASFDGGNLWQRQDATNTSTINLNSVYFYNSSHGFSVGDFGKIIGTTNAGSNWTTLTSGISSNLNNVFFITENDGFAVGDNGVILHTNNAGLTWDQQTSGTTSKLKSVYFKNLLTGFAVGEKGTILQTVNGGITWVNQNQFIGTFYSVNFNDPAAVYAVGENGSIVKSIDQGNSWIHQNSGVNNNLYSTYFLNADIGYSVGESGIILKTIDGGTTWENNVNGLTDVLNSVFFTDTQVGYAVGGNLVIPDFFSSDTAVILKTIDGGNNWFKIFDGAGMGMLHDVFFTDSTTGYAVGGSMFQTFLKKTIDGGLNWIDISNSISPGYFGTLLSIHFLNDSLGFASGDNGGLLKTTDRGQTWTSFNSMSIASADPVNSVFFTDENNGYTAFAGLIAFTQNGGLNFAAQELVGSGNRVESIHFLDSAIGYAVGSSGGIFKYVDTTCNTLDANFTSFDEGNGSFTFLNTSVGNYDLVHWSFGDGNSSDLTNPSHTFSADGTYIVNLSIKNSGANEICLSHQIDTFIVNNVLNPSICQAGFIIYPDSSSNNITIVNSSTGNNLTYLWDFGDGSSSSLPFPSHYYSDNGPYYLCLTINDGVNCISSYCDSINRYGVVFDKQLGFNINIISSNISELNVEEKFVEPISVYPNPTSENVTIKNISAEIINVEIVDITGKTMSTFLLDVKDEIHYDIRTFECGFYFFKIKSSQGISTLRFIKN